MLDIPNRWRNEALITDIRLVPAGQACSKPAFSHLWPGTTAYETQVTVSDDEHDGIGGRLLEDATESSSSE